ncbi:unnamed protein product [Ectocarpus sp. 13 AM-2016]
MAILYTSSAVIVANPAAAFKFGAFPINHRGRPTLPRRRCVPTPSCAGSWPSCTRGVAWTTTKTSRATPCHPSTPILLLLPSSPTPNLHLLPRPPTGKLSLLLLPPTTAMMATTRAPPLPTPFQRLPPPPPPLGLRRLLPPIRRLRLRPTLATTPLLVYP